MTIKKRFYITYLGGIFVAAVSLLSVILISIYLVTGITPSPVNLYKLAARERPLSEEEQTTFVEMRSLAKRSPDLFQSVSQNQLFTFIQEIEKQNLAVVIRKEGKVVYYSDGLVKKSLLAHFPEYEADNLKTKGTIDNAGQLYRYTKFDFQTTDQQPIGFLILKKESNFSEFFYRWGVFICILILVLGLLFLILFKFLISKHVINPILSLRKNVENFSYSDFDELDAPIVIDQQTDIEILELSQAFEQMRAKLKEQLEKEKRYEANRIELMSNISHDLKTPITSIIGHVEGLQDGVAQAKGREKDYLKVIHSKAVSLNYLIEELFLISTLDANTLKFDFQTLDVQAFLKHLAEEYTLEMNQKEQIIQFDLTQIEAEQFILADQQKLQRVFDNLLQNSFKFKDIEKEQLMIHITAQIVDKEICISIADNGIGISEAHFDKIFEQSYRVDQARDTRIGGAGLGLSIVKQIVEKHHGRIELTSKVHEGTTIAIYFKLIEKRQQDEEANLIN